MHHSTENTTIVVYHTDPMYQAGKTIENDAATLMMATQTFWGDYQMIISNALLPRTIQMALETLLNTCEQPLVDLLTTRSHIGTTLEGAAAQAADLEETLQISFIPSM